MDDQHPRTSGEDETSSRLVPGMFTENDATSTLVASFHFECVFSYFLELVLTPHPHQLRYVVGS